MRKFLSLMMAMMLMAGSAFATTIYCKMDKSWWKADGAAVAVHHWGGETAATTWPGVRMTPVEGDADVWSYDVPADVTGLIFVRVNGSGDIADWGAKTADLTIPTDGKNLYTITSETPVWGNPGVTGEWSTYTPGETPAPAPKQYYAKYAPNWEYKLMTEAAGMWLTDTIVYKGIGININDVADGDGLFYSNEEIEGARAIAGAAIATNDTIYFSFNPADSVLTAVMVGQYVEPVAPVAHYYLAGTMNNWTIGATEFVAGNEDTLSVSVALAADSVYEFKIVKVLDTDTVWFGNTEAATMVYGNSTGWWLKGEANVGLQTTSAADYLFIFKANENNEISVVIPEPETPQPQLENGYYLVGKFGGVDAWSVADLSAEKRFAQNPENESEYMLAINLDVNDEIKVVYVENDAIQTWFPAEGENYVINDHHNGATTMFFRPDCQGGEGWFAGCIYVVPTSTVGVENTNAVIEAVKVVRNGQILIIRGEHSYTVMGQMIK